MVELKTKAFTIKGNSITEVVEAWFRVKPTFNQYEDVVILSIEKVPTVESTIPEKDQSNDQSQA